MIIDIHTHFFPKENLEGKLRAFNEDYWLNLLFPKEGKSLQDLPSQEEFIEAMDEAGIDKAVIMGAYWQSWQACEYFNESALNFAKNFPNRILPFAIINPSFVEESIEFLKKARGLGFVGLGELCDSVQGFEVMSDGFCEIVEICQAENFPICLHLSDEVGKNYKGKVITNNQAHFELAKKFPKQNFIFSHLAGGRAFLNAPLPENIYQDTAAFPLLYKKEQWRTLDLKANKNLCFGTDYSLRIYPKSQKKADFLSLKTEAKTHLPQAFHKDFFHKNAEKLFLQD